MNIKLFEYYFSDLVLYTVSEQAKKREDTNVSEENPNPEEEVASKPEPNVPLQPEVSTEEEANYQGGIDPNMASQADQASPGQGVDPNTGLPIADSGLEVSLGRVFELKKIYARLLSISKLLDNYSNIEYNEVNKKVLQSLELFHVIALNLTSFKEKIDDIIVKFYEFVTKILEEIETISKKVESQDKQRQSKLKIKSVEDDKLNYRNMV